MTNEPIGKNLTSNLILKQIIQNVLENNSNLQTEFDDSKKEYSLRFGKELFDACLDGNINAAQLLLEKGAEINWVDEHGRTPLYIACNQGKVDAVRLLLDKGAEVDRSAKVGASALIVACCKGHADVAQLLIDSGANVNQADDRMLLRIVCENDHVDVARLLIDKGANVNQTDIDGMTLLNIACQNGHVNVAQLLLEKGAEVNLTDKSGVTPLWVACANDYPDMARLLLEKGADVNWVHSCNGFTPLHIACQNNNSIDMVQLLIDNNANINCLTKEGQRPIDIACEMKHFNIIDKLCVKKKSVIHGPAATYTIIPEAALLARAQEQGQVYTTGRGVGRGRGVAGLRVGRGVADPSRT